MQRNDENHLHRINASIAVWEQQRDQEAITKLDEILSPDLLFRRADKTVIGKREFMAALREPSPFAKRDSQQATVEVR
jgi:hypothetical protein